MWRLYALTLAACACVAVLYVRSQTAPGHDASSAPAPAAAETSPETKRRPSRGAVVAPSVIISTPEADPDADGAASDAPIAGDEDAAPPTPGPTGGPVTEGTIAPDPPLQVAPPAREPEKRPGS